MRRLRTLYFKIFGWFWLTLTVGSIVVVMLTIAVGTRPLGERWMRMTQDMYAHSAVDFYESGGPPALARYLEILRNSSGIHAQLLDETQRDVLGAAILPNVGAALQASLITGRSTFRLGKVWTAASPIRYQQRRYVFVVEAYPLHGFIPWDGTFVFPFLLRFTIALFVASGFCLLLARHIVAPVRALQVAALRLAAGDLNMRVMPAIAPRDDELADTARAFDQMADRVQLLIQKRQELLADISHELRSPLTRLSVSLELMRRGEHDVLEKMQLDLDRMNTMISHVLLLTRLDMQLSQPAMNRVEIRQLLEAIAQEAEFEVQDNGTTVSLRVDKHCYVLGDANLLRSCLENIVRNAVRYTRPGSSVDISAEVIERYAGSTRCQIVVMDYGPGVPEHALPLLFDPFYRVSESRDRQEGGSGLGLSISQRVVTLHQGTITAENRSDGTGLVIRIDLPAA